MHLSRVADYLAWHPNQAATVRLELPLRLRLFATAFALAGIAGCHDASSDPLAVMLTEETRSVLAADRLPSLERVASDAGQEERLAAPLERWSLSWDLAVEEGRPLRTAALAEAAGPLAETLGPAAVAESVRAVGATLEAAAALDEEALGDEIARSLEQARARHAFAVAALASGSHRAALENALAASDLVREVGPESVSRLLLARAESRLDSMLVEGAEPSPEIDLERGERLVRGAHLALAEGDFVRAIQRAFYACQVLGLTVN